MNYSKVLWKLEALHRGTEVISAVCQIFLLPASQTHYRILSPPCSWLSHVSSLDEELGLEMNTYLQGKDPPESPFLCHCGWQLLRRCLLIRLAPWVVASRALSQPSMAVWTRNKTLPSKVTETWNLVVTAAWLSLLSWYKGDFNISVFNVFNLCN